jgi:hypothetical protein
MMSVSMICASVRSVDKKVTMTSLDTNIQLSIGPIVRLNSMTISQPSSSKSRERQEGTMSEKVARVTRQIEAEVNRAIELHAPMHSLHEAKAVIEEEFDELWEQVKINIGSAPPAER